MEEGLRPDSSICAISATSQISREPALGGGERPSVPLAAGELPVWRHLQDNINTHWAFRAHISFGLYFRYSLFVST